MAQRLSLETPGNLSERMVSQQTIIRVLLLFLLLLPISHSATESVAFAQTASVPDVQAEERQRGIELHRQEKFAEAAKLLKKFLKKNRSDNEGWYYLGLALLQQPKEMKEASKAFETSLKLRPNFAPAHAGLAYSLLLREKTNEALRKAQEAISIDPNIPDAHYVRGVALLRMGNREEALREANKAIELNPQLASPYLLKSQALVTSVLVPPVSTPEGRAMRTAVYRDAADALAKFLQMAKSSEASRIWDDQLEALRFYVSVQSKKLTEREAIDPADATVRVRVISKPEPQYTEEARQNQVTGTVVLRAVMTADGTVTHILIVQSLPNGLTQRAIEAAQRIKFAPAMLNGRPVSTFIQLEYNFNLY